MPTLKVSCAVVGVDPSRAATARPIAQPLEGEKARVRFQFTGSSNRTGIQSRKTTSIIGIPLQIAVSENTKRRLANDVEASRGSGRNLSFLQFPLNLPLGLPLFDCLPLVVELFAAGHAQMGFDPAAVEHQLEGNHGQALLFHQAP
jgi:hypothetical protein